MLIELKGKYILITGATRGVGRAIALALASENVTIFITARNEKLIQEVKQDIEKLGSKAIPIITEFSDLTSIDKIIEEINKNTEKLDILINNAAIGIAKPFKESTIEEWDRIMTVNAKFPFFLIQKVLPYLEKSDIATIVNISSVSGRMSYEYQSLYAASKHALMGFTKALAREVQKNNIRVHTISPGAIATDMINTMRPDLDKSVLIKPEEIAEIVLFLIKFKGNSMIDNIDVRRVNGTPFV